jgi:hypothetical protein
MAGAEEDLCVSPPRHAVADAAEPSTPPSCGRYILRSSPAAAAAMTPRAGANVERLVLGVGKLNSLLNPKTFLEYLNPKPNLNPASLTVHPMP